MSADDFLNVPLSLLKNIGINLSENEKLRQNLALRKKIKNFLRKIHFFNIVTNLIGVLIMNIFPIFVAVNFKDSFLFLLNTSYFSTVLFKLLTVVYQKDKLLQIFNNLRQIFPKTKSDQDRHQTVKYYQKFSSFWKVYRTILKVTAVVMIIAALAIFFNHEEKYDSIFIIKPTGIFSIILHTICTSWNTIILLTVQALNDMLFVTIATMLSMNFDNLSRDFKSELSKSNLNMKSLKILIDRHINLFELSEKTQEIYSSIFLYSFVNSSVIIALFCADMTVGDVVAKVSGLVSFAFISLHTFLPYYHGQKVYDSSSRIFYSIIDSKWYNLKNESVKKSVGILLTNAQNSVFFTGCDFFVVDCETYMNLLMSAYSYFTLLINIHQNLK
ncbi:hypothetical protein PVAND_009440 [Polypedilum vanderplanki]|uniref:Odorant receptor n=1 Tax=Polypedilum vanderplanki TaxID=319348 RepID=A0A9J6CDJ1_POLVA|nr:hypothetical protein PVAND_009440 [Polypedilum vanderplanki]